MAKAPARQPGTATLVGRLVGATVALPAASVVMLVAIASGSTLSTMVTRTVLAGIGFYIALSLIGRILALWVIRDFAKRAEAMAAQELAPDADPGGLV